MRSKFRAILLPTTLALSLSISGCSGGEEKIDVGQWCSESDSVTACEGGWSETIRYLEESGYEANSRTAGEAANLCLLRSDETIYAQSDYFGDQTGYALGCLGAYRWLGLDTSTE